jgi:hypothetical protein
LIIRAEFALNALDALDVVVALSDRGVLTARFVADILVVAIAVIAAFVALILVAETVLLALTFTPETIPAALIVGADTVPDVATFTANIVPDALTFAVLNVVVLMLVALSVVVTAFAALNVAHEMTLALVMFCCAAFNGTESALNAKFATFSVFAVIMFVFVML